MSTTPEFERWLAVSEIRGRSVVQRLEASPAERTALARRYGVPAVNSLVAEVAVRPLGPGRWRLDGAFEASLTQICVVSLEEMATTVADRFSVIFESDPAAPPALDEVEFDATADDPPEPLVDGRIPVGETVAQYVALAIDAYPRRPDAALDQDSAGDGAAEKPRQSPFAILRKLG